MRNIKRAAVLFTILALGATSVVFAATSKTKDNQETTTQETTKKTVVVVKAPSGIEKGYADGKPALLWKKDKSIDKVEVWYSESKTGKYVLNDTTGKQSYKLSRFSDGKIIYVKLRSKRTLKGKTYYSKFSKVTPLTTNVVMRGISTLGAGIMQFKWEKADTANGYDIQYATKADFSDAVTISNLKKSRIKYKVYGLSQGTKYYARVRAITTFANGVNHGLWTKAKSVTVASVADVTGSSKNTGGFFKDSVFFGDSVLQGFGNYVNAKGDGYLDGARVMGVVSYSLISALKENSEYHPLYQGKHTPPQTVAKAIGAKKVFLFFGVNDIWNTQNPDYCLDNYKQLIKNIKRVNPKVKIYIISSTYPMKGSNKCVEFSKNMHRFNELLKEYCSNNSYEYIEIADYLSTNDGYLKSSICSDNFVHQTMAAYQIWDSALRYYAWGQNKLNNTGSK